MSKKHKSADEIFAEHRRLLLLDKIAHQQELARAKEMKQKEASDPSLKKLDLEDFLARRHKIIRSPKKMPKN